MARAKKEAALTPEERLQAALVPDWEWPYKLPGNWCWTYLTKAAECLDNFRKPINATERAGRNGNVPYYGATGQVGWIDDFLTDEDLVLLGEDGAPFLDLIKDKAYLITGKAWVNNHAHILRSLFGDTGNRYLLHYLNSFNYAGYVNGTTRLKLTRASMDTIPIPLPPLAEQQRIVDRIESLFAKLDEAKEKAQAVVDSFETRKAAILHKAFTGELTAKWREEHGVGMESWEKHLLSTVSSLQTGLMKGKKYTGKTVELPYLRVANVQDGFLRLDEIKKIDVEENAISRYSLAVGDVLFTEGGDFDKLGRGTVWEGQIKNCLHQNHIFVVRPNPEVLNPYFLSYQAGSRYGKAYFLSCSKQTTNLASINSTQLKNFPVLIPSMMEQEMIIRLLDSSLEKEQQTKNIAESVLDQIDLMKKSILARAFRGELGTNDPSEESAVELLKKVLHTSAEPKSKTKRKFIPPKIEAQIKTDLERKIIMAFIQSDTAIMPIQQLMSVSSRKFDVIETLRNLQERGILLKENDTYRLMG